MLTLVLAESALETVPEQLWKHRGVQRYAKLRGKHLRFVILDRSYHHDAMKAMHQDEKRGRPDITHFALLEALGSPLNKERLLTVYVHTIGDFVISVNPETRLPRNCNRFTSLMEQLFEFKRVPTEQSKSPLMTMKPANLSQLIREINPSYVMAFSRLGTPKTVEETITELAKQEKPAVLVGGFPHGHLSETAMDLADEVVCVDKETLETWTIISRLVYDFERALSLPTKRLARSK